MCSNLPFKQVATSNNKFKKKKNVLLFTERYLKRIKLKSFQGAFAVTKNCTNNISSNTAVFNHSLMSACASVRAFSLHPNLPLLIHTHKKSIKNAAAVKGKRNETSSIVMM